MRSGRCWPLIALLPFVLTSCGGGGGSSSPPLSCTPSGGISFSGKSFSFKLPTGIAVDGANNIWVTNTDGNTVTELPASNPNTPVVYSSTSFHFDLPADVAVDGNNNVWITNLNNASVTKIPAGAPNSPQSYRGRFRKRKIKHAKDQLISKKESQSSCSVLQMQFAESMARMDQFCMSSSRAPPASGETQAQCQCSQGRREYGDG